MTVFEREEVREREGEREAESVREFESSHHCRGDPLFPRPRVGAQREGGEGERRASACSEWSQAPREVATITTNGGVEVSKDHEMKGGDGGAFYHGF